MAHCTHLKIHLVRFFTIINLHCCRDLQQHNTFLLKFAENTKHFNNGAIHTHTICIQTFINLYSQCVSSMFHVAWKSQPFGIFPHSQMLHLHGKDSVRIDILVAISYCLKVCKLFHACRVRYSIQCKAWRRKWNEENELMYENLKRHDTHNKHIAYT